MRIKKLVRATLRITLGAIFTIAMASISGLATCCNKILDYLDDTEDEPP